ncbi:uncharacterized protein DS421_11g335740 [Arachis hypogaea]|nr:uncharacterized protein DS421_11g335740 [Arachis hypogaea]
MEHKYYVYVKGTPRVLLYLYTFKCMYLFRTLLRNGHQTWHVMRRPNNNLLAKPQ